MTGHRAPQLPVQLPRLEVLALSSAVTRLTNVLALFVYELPTCRLGAGPRHATPVLLLLSLTTMLVRGHLLLTVWALVTILRTNGMRRPLVSARLLELATVR